MKRLLILIFLFLNLIACSIAPTATSESKTLTAQTNKVFLQSINFYTDNTFTKSATPHPYMDTTQAEIQKLIKARLPLYKFQQIYEISKRNEALCIQIDVHISPGLLIVTINLRARVYWQDKLICEVQGIAGSPPIESRILKTQEQLADKLMEVFAEKVRHAQKN